MELRVKKSMQIKDYKKLVQSHEAKIKGKNLKEIEELIYRDLGKEDYLYGSDTPGSLFKKSSNYPWDLTSLDSTLNDCLGKKALDGITKPYLYIGGYGTIFSWHVEDYNMPSINYMHLGAPKIWYVIARDDY